MRTLLFNLLLAAVLIVSGCRKPAPLSDADAVTTTTSAEPESTDVVAIERRYPTLTDPVERFDAINALAGAPAAEAVPAIGRLVAFEKDPELRAALIESLSDFDEEVAARLAILSPLVGNAAEPEEVREAALDCLDLIDDRAAIPVWQKLVDNADETVREIARARLEELADLPAE